MNSSEHFYSKRETMSKITRATKYVKALISHPPLPPKISSDSYMQAINKIESARESLNHQMDQFETLMDDMRSKGWLGDVDTRGQ